jgi:hypothetical protein
MESGFLPIWDCCFIIDGMTITGVPFPRKRIEIDDNMILTRVEGKPGQCVAHIRVQTKEGEELSVSEGYKAAKQRILDFVSTYALKTHRIPVIQDAGASTMKESDRLGDAKGHILRATVTYPKEDKKKHIKRESVLLAKTIDHFKSNEKIFRDNSWLRNALRYFYFAMMNERLEDKLINMTVSLEALFFGKEERGELRYRLSLRAATLIGNMFDDKTTKEVFDDIKKLYDKRCDVVHGRVTKVTHDDIHKLETYTRRAIEIFVLMLHTQSKESILQLLDHCLVDKESVDKLREITLEKKME